MTYSFYRIAFIFIIYAVIGWLTEEVFALTKHGKLVNRGFLKGPVCPIYGFGVVIIVLCLTPIKEYTVLLFIGAVVLTTALELLTGYVLEKFYKTKWWDYSDRPFNYKGYICLSFSLIWGLACVFVMEIAHPAIMKIVDKIPVKVGVAVLCAAYALILADLITTVITMEGFRKRLASFEELSERLEKLGDDMREKAADLSAEMSAKKDELAEKLEELGEAVAQKNAIREAERDARKEEQLAALKEKLMLFSEEIHTRYRRTFDAFPQLEASRHFKKYRKDFEEFMKSRKK